MNDPITDLLNRIRNASLARHASTRVPFSKIKAQIAKILKDEGYIEDFSIAEGKGVSRELVVYLRYIDDSRTAINTMRRVSKPGRRYYCGVKEVPEIRAGLGVAIISTSKGIVTDREARKLNVGGEVLCEIW